jgi:hypothetical protein
VVLEMDVGVPERVTVSTPDRVPPWIFPICGVLVTEATKDGGRVCATPVAKVRFASRDGVVEGIDPTFRRVKEGCNEIVGSAIRG